MLPVKPRLEPLMRAAHECVEGLAGGIFRAVRQDARLDSMLPMLCRGLNDKSTADKNTRCMLGDNVYKVTVTRRRCYP